MHGHGEAAAQLGEPDEQQTQAVLGVHGEVRQEPEVFEDIVAQVLGFVDDEDGELLGLAHQSGDLGPDGAVAALALGMTVPAASRVLIPASRPAQRFTPSEAAAARPAVVLAPVTARADEHLAPASGTEKQSGIVHCSPRRGGLDDPRSPGNTALGAVRKCGSGRSLGRDRQVSAVRGCVSLLADSDLTPTHQRCHRRYARRACPLAGSIGSGGKQRHVPGGRGGTIQRWFASTGTVSSRGLFAIYPRIFTATNTRRRDRLHPHRHHH